jgi:hypothetical protein
MGGGTIAAGGKCHATGAATTPAPFLSHREDHGVSVVVGSQTSGSALQTRLRSPDCLFLEVLPS